MAPSDDLRARLEAEAANILGAARANAAEILRHARTEGDDVRGQANRYAAERVREADAALMRARREVVKAQEQALAIRSEAQRTADALVRRATDRARVEADDLLRDAQRRLARAIDDARDAERRVQAARAAEADAQARLDAARAAEAETLARIRTIELDALERMMHSDPAPTPTPATAPASARVVDLRGEPIDEMVAGAVHAAVRRAVHPVVIRAGRYTTREDPSSS